VLVVVDRFSKMCHLMLLSDDTTAPAVADAFFENVVKLHGLPKTIVSDRDPRFTSRFWRELFSQLRT
jgi:Integrase core domain